MALSKGMTDKVVAGLIGAAASALVGAAVEMVPKLSLPDRIFYTESQRDVGPDGTYSTIIGIINPSDKDIPEFTLSLSPKDETKPVVVEQFSDNDFKRGGTPPSISYAGSTINLSFARLPPEGRYTLVVNSPSEFEIGSDDDRAVARPTQGKLKLTKLKREYYRSLQYENWYFLLAGMLAGPFALLAYQSLKRRRTRHQPTPSK